MELTELPLIAQRQVFLSFYKKLNPCSKRTAYRNLKQSELEEFSRTHLISPKRAESKRLFMIESEEQISHLAESWYLVCGTPNPSPGDVYEWFVDSFRHLLEFRADGEPAMKDSIMEACSEHVDRLREIDPELFQESVI